MAKLSYLTDSFWYAKLLVVLKKAFMWLNKPASNGDRHIRTIRYEKQDDKQWTGHKACFDHRTTATAQGQEALTPRIHLSGQVLPEPGLHSNLHADTLPRN